MILCLQEMEEKERANRLLRFTQVEYEPKKTSLEDEFDDDDHDDELKELAGVSGMDSASYAKQVLRAEGLIDQSEAVSDVPGKLHNELAGKMVGQKKLKKNAVAEQIKMLEQDKVAEKEKMAENFKMADRDNLAGKSKMSEPDKMAPTEGDVVYRDAVAGFVASSRDVSVSHVSG